MKRVVLVLLVAVIAGLAAFFWMRSYQRPERNGVMLDSMPELAWLRTDLKLSEQQFAEVSRLHAAYRPQCEKMCMEIAGAREKLEAAILRNRGMNDEVQAAIRKHAETRAKCRQAMLNHMYETAAVLDANQAGQYLKTMLPFVMDDAEAGAGSHGSH
jgi:hypothetical protein